jgi:hypothetical protein
MRKDCPLCGRPFQHGDLVEVTVIAPWIEIPSKISYAIGKPIDTYPDTLQHTECPDD